MAGDRIDHASLILAVEETSHDTALPQVFFVADYIAEMATELGRMAKNSRLSTVAYLLGMVALEAKKVYKH